MPPPKKKRPRPRPARHRHDPPPSPQVRAPAPPEVKPEIAAIIQRTRNATTRAELRDLCEQAIELQPNDAETLRTFYKKKMDALPPEA